MKMSNITSEARTLSLAVGEHRLLGWNVLPSEMPFIPEHWLMYPEPEASIHYLLALIYVGFFIAAIIGNGLVIWIFLTAKSLRTPSNVFVVSLALCDFFMMSKVSIFIYNSFSRGFAAGGLGCQIYGFIGSLTGIAAGMTNACIAYDRYTTISKPFDAKMTQTKAVCMALLVWLYALPWALMPMMRVWGQFVAEGYLTACSFDFLTTSFDNRLFVATIFVCSYVVPMSMIIYFYSKIVSHVINHEKLLKKQAKTMNVESLRCNQNQGNQSVEIRIAKAAITVCFLFVASWTPYAVLALIGAFGDQALLTPGVAMIPALTCKLVACIDPFVYAISHPRYRVELQKRLPWLAIKESLSDNRSTGTETASTVTSTT